MTFTKDDLSLIAAACEAMAAKARPDFPKAAAGYDRVAERARHEYRRREERDRRARMERKLMGLDNPEADAMDTEGNFPDYEPDASELAGPSVSTRLFRGS